MTLDLTKTLTTRDGRPVRLLAQDVVSDYPIVGVIKNSDGSDDVRVWNKNGGLIHGHQTQTDLINPPERVTGWINVYPMKGTPNQQASTIHESKDQAALMAAPGRIGCLFVDFELGEGL